ncbi:hypothetical protein JOH50_006704 [Rhizobium leguminosarum]|uniref:hypothetical protein n=1 Tax=Rhizobium leguminosarum TaxID=384 RepID=UPI001AE188BE|nr:hypothetical protein [Rhizobium leguminosarum]MBP2490908.1 hypothetical protein [Rhizobium leguminosarum]
MQKSLFLALAALLLSAAPTLAATNKWERTALTYLQELDGDTGKTRIEAARYMERNCTPVAKDWAISHRGLEAYESLPVARCVYPRSQTKTEYREALTLTAVVWMLNPDAATLAKWIGGACSKAKAEPTSSCGRKFAAFILNQNGAQFAVAGHVIETQKEAGCEACVTDALIYLPFRDGITVKLQDDDPKNRRQKPFADEREAAEAAEKTLSDPATFQPIGDIGRVGNIYRLPHESDLDWLARNRSTYLLALQSGSYDFLDQEVEKALIDKAHR